MQAVLDQLAALGPKPIETLTPAEARKQPTPADAVKALLKKQGKSDAPEPVGKVENRTIQVNGGTVPIRIYWPTGQPPFPILLYIHGGGWVIATIDTYDASARGRRTEAVIPWARAAIRVSGALRAAPAGRRPEA